MAGFFYDIKNSKRHFTGVTGDRPSLSFLPFLMDNVAISDCCNGLILCWCVGAIGYRYVVYHQATRKLLVLPPSICSVGEARLGFDPIVSSHFHVFEYVEEDDCVIVEIYSSEIVAWIYKESE
ncbi:uncharacterized protein [Miscanthus floridulus]|uniref:uncharacterized protein n=1 Tax=Miscanthus floridulus TaxID=154761 RepID=UPI00345B415E